MPPPLVQGLRHQVVAAGRPRHGDAQTEDTLLQTQTSRADTGGRGRDQAAAGLPQALGLFWRPWEAQTAPRRRPVGKKTGGILTCRLCGTDTAEGKKKSA